MRKIILPAFWGVAILVAGCGKIVAPEEPESFGLAKAEFNITSEYLGMLNSHVFIRRDVPARLEIDGRDRKVLVRYSGQTSIGQLKKSYTFEFADGQKFREHREYVLSAQNGDSTKLNSTIGFWAFRQAGLLAPEAEPVAVYLNGEYQGLYYLIEPIDADFFKIRNQSLGSLYEAFNGQQIGARFSFAGGYDVRLGFESKGERPEFFGDLEHLIRTLDASTPETLPARLEPLLDVENYLRYLAVSVLLHNWDGYFNNFRLHLDPQIGKFQIIPWDVDNFLELHPERSRLEGANELSEKLLQVQAYRQRYRAILLELVDEKLTVSRLDSLIDVTAAKIAPAYAADRLLAAAGTPLSQHVTNVKQCIRDWYEKIRGDLVKLE
ncbi:CotH kinase family protein [candidate division KSB1 bacterium]|nr:CotH kinase family protein [candidate division KSB1 bacterium]